MSAVIAKANARAQAALTEAQFQSQVIALAKLHGWLIMHSRPALNQSGRWSTPITGHKGYPDLTLARDGSVIFAELKSQKGRASAEQREWLTNLGDDAYLWRPSDWPEIEQVLGRHRDR